jgi:hypothetical protein
MARKKRSEDEIDPIAGLIIIIILGIYFVWTYIIKPIINWIIYQINQVINLVNQNIGIIIIVILFAVILLVVWLRKKQHEEEQRNFERIKYVEEQTAKGLVNFSDRFGKVKWGSLEEIEEWKRRDEEEEMKESLLYRVFNSIEDFKPSRKYKNEFGYHTELQGWLKAHFPSAKVEIQTGASRPDIIIDDIAIEVKGPTDSQALNTLTTKCLKYSKYYTNIICVLFEPSFTDKNFQEIQEGIASTFSNVSIIVK